MPRFLLAIILSGLPLLIIAYIFHFLNFDGEIGGAVAFLGWIYIFIKMEEHNHWYTNLIHKISPF
jgi:hypothetical protein